MLFWNRHGLSAVKNASQHSIVTRLVGAIDHFFKIRLNTCSTQIVNVPNYFGRVFGSIGIAFQHIIHDLIEHIFILNAFFRPEYPIPLVVGIDYFHRGDGDHGLKARIITHVLEGFVNDL